MTTNVMTMVVDGAVRAAQLVPLMFTLGALQPAAAQLPRPVLTAAAPVSVMAVAPVGRPAVLDPGAAMDPLQLTLTHVDVQVDGRRALVRTTLIYRNDSGVPVDALYAVRLPALFGAPGVPLVRLGQADAVQTLENSRENLGESSGDPQAEGDCGGDEPYAVAQFAEAGESLDARYERGSVLVQPGEEVTLVLAREVDLVSRGDRHRLVLPLDFRPRGSFAPHFSAELAVSTDRPVRTLNSATHGGTASGMGSNRARLVIPDGRLVEGQFLALDFEVGEDATAPVLTADTAQITGTAATAATADTPVRNAAAWGSEGRGLARTAFMSAAR